MIRPREEWLDPQVPWDHTVNGKGQFYICPNFLGWSQISDAVVHYPGADWADMDFNNDGSVDLADTVTIVREMHRMYLLGSRGYSLGYGFAVGQLGDVWEVRGWRNTNAANLGDAAHKHVGWNNYSISILVIVDNANPANPLQVDAVNGLLDELANRKGSRLNLLWHGQGQYTACAGAGIIDQIQRGVIDFGHSAPIVIDPPPPAQISGSYPPGSRDVMYPIDYGIAGTDSWWTEMAITPKGLQWSGGPSVESQKIREIFVAVPMPRAPRLQNDADVVTLMRTIGTFGDCPSTFLSNTTLREAWAANLNPGR